MQPIPEIITERLLLRPFAASDIDRVNELLARPEIADTTQNIQYPYPEGAAAGWIDSQPEAAERGEAFTWAVCRREDGLLMGAIAIHVNAHDRRGEVGYWLGVPYWNQGFMTEATDEVIAFGFEALLLHRIQAKHLVRNPGSGRVMQKAGMRHEGTLRDYVRKNGVFEDVAYWAILRDEWKSATDA